MTCHNGECLLDTHRHGEGMMIDDDDTRVKEGGGVSPR
eukprot:CAMPEP_0197600254 /NCGR_PEP_ID=MMETSP1326-20131121/32932_1 /TAXON_ID=1155430 /ORGANISM="Genus nov. species nov., Strain RCC2288" /LENGTH=37 /DNA_ID= /DNA_START= /DNA_END= /DNA_ORIENTATION=